MIKLNIDRLHHLFETYKQHFVANFVNERYKWIAAEHFQRNWDIDASDFTAMLLSAMAKTDNLLASNHHFPLGMLQRFCETDVEEVRRMFRNLYDETQDVYDRITVFRTASEVLLARCQKTGISSPDAMHFQEINSISTYLWLRYPNQYYIYKYSEIKTAIKELEVEMDFKSGLRRESIENALELFNSISEYISKDSEFVAMHDNALTSDCYRDSSMHLATIDFVFFINRYYPDIKAVDSKPRVWVYAPGQQASYWDECLRDGRMYLGWDELGDFNQYKTKESIVLKLQELGDAKGTFANDALAVWNFLQGLNVGDIVFAKKGTTAVLGRGIIEGNYEYDSSRKTYKNYRSVKWTHIGEWKSLEHNHPVKTLTDITPYKDYVEDLENLVANHVSEPRSELKVRKWWMNSNPSIWSASGGWSVGTEESYTLYNENGNKRRIFQNFMDAKPGDQLICYEAAPTKQIVALAEVTARDDAHIRFRKLENLTTAIDYADLKAVAELQQMEFFVNPNGSLFKLTDEEFDIIMDIIRESNPLVPHDTLDEYTEQDFFNEVYVSKDDMNALQYLLRNKKNVILQGAPGVGKTFSARRLAYLMMGCKDDRRICMVQFHQNYSYEDFVLGYKPVDDGFKLKEGKFYNFCVQAANDPQHDYFFIIDEINRGNLSKIFGELLMSIESSYRGAKIRLAYGDREFTVPENLYIIGMMNTADRSLAMIDYALRRRFSFFKMKPGFDSDGFKGRIKATNNPKLNHLVEEVKQLNSAIAKDDSLGEGFQIGHSYFCKEGTVDDQWLDTLVRFDLLPMLEEYWFDNKSQYDDWSTRLLNSIND